MSTLDPSTDIHLNRMLHWRWLIEQMALAPAKRAAEIQPTINGARLDMNVVTDGKLVDDHFCISACCAIGTAALYRPFNHQGLDPYVLEYDGELSASFVLLDKERTFYGDVAVSGFFGISNDLYTDITDPNQYVEYDNDDQPLEHGPIEPHEVIERINRAIEDTFGKDAVALRPVPFTDHAGDTP